MNVKTERANVMVVLPFVCGRSWTSGARRWGRSGRGRDTSEISEIRMTSVGAPELKDGILKDFESHCTIFGPFAGRKLHRSQAVLHSKGSRLMPMSKNSKACRVPMLQQVLYPRSAFACQTIATDVPPECLPCLTCKHLGTCGLRAVVMLLN